LSILLLNKEVSVLKAIVTGGAGFIGSHLVDCLLEENYEVTVIDNLERGKASNLAHCMDKITFLHADLRKEPQHIEVNADDGLVFDFAAKVCGVRQLYDEPWSMLSNNMEIVLNSLKRWRDARKYIYISSSCVYDWEGVPIPHRETDVGYLDSFYGWSKLFGELCCEACSRENDLDYTILRPFNVYGPRETLFNPHVIPDFIRKACDCKFNNVEAFEILGDGTQTRSFTYSSDIVEGIMLAIDKGRRTAYNLGYPEEVKIMALAKLIWDIMDITPEPFFVPASEQEVKFRGVDIEKIKTELGWKPKVGLKKGLEKTIEYMVPLIRACE